MVQRPIYLDFAATTPVDPRVAQLVCHVMTEEFGNAGSRTHMWGTEARKLVDRAREQIATAVDSSPDEVIFTSGATESNNLAILGLSEYGLAESKRHIISTQIEHKAVLEPLFELERRGFEVTLLPPNEGGWVPPEAVAASLRPETLLVSVMHVNNETGIVQPIEEICQVLSNHTAFLHMDAVQGFGKDLLTPKLKRVDMISISGHKIYAPKGIGALVTRRRKFKRPPLTPLMYGGGQEFGLRPGTQPVHQIAGLDLAIELCIVENIERKNTCLKLFNAFESAISQSDFSLLGDRERAIGNIMAVSHHEMDSEALIMLLKETVGISNGAACSGSNYQESHVFRAMDPKGLNASKTLRLSWSHFVPDHIPNTFANLMQSGI